MDLQKNINRKILKHETLFKDFKLSTHNKNEEAILINTCYSPDAAQLNINMRLLGFFFTEFYLTQPSFCR